MLPGKPQRRFGSAHAIAIAALFFALGGGAYAAVQATLPPDSVGTKQLQKEAVTPPKLSKSFSRELKRLIKKYTPQPKEIIGPAGPAGAPGKPGEPGPSDTYIAGSSGGSLSASNTVIASITVPPGQYLIQGKNVLVAAEAEKSVSGGCLIGSDANGSTTWDGSEASIPAFPTANATATIALAGAASFSPIAGTRPRPRDRSSRPWSLRARSGRRRLARLARPIR
ncbi:MAG: hypothetical protein ACTHO8_09395 [Solirubrobacterales bacterium]